MTNVLPFTARVADADTTNNEGTGTADVLAMNDARAVYTVREVAQMLSLSLGGTYQLCRSGEIPALKLGNRWVVPKRRLHAWLDDLPAADAEDIETKPKGR